MQPYYLKIPTLIKYPILISVPHCGTEFPAEVLTSYDESMIQEPADTDWHVDQLYDFHTTLGIPLIKSKYSRYLIDLNRNSKNENLYNDSRSQTSLMPIKTFAQKNIYQQNLLPDSIEQSRRLEKYYQPYYHQIKTILAQLKDQFGYAILFEAHSIKRFVPQIHPSPFPDLILGDLDNTTADSNLINFTLDFFQNGPYSISHNHPFKGGNITRHFGDPINKIHAIQLEMSQDIYMNESNYQITKEKFNKINQQLDNFFTNLISSGLKL